MMDHDDGTELGKSKRAQVLLKLNLDGWIPLVYCWAALVGLVVG